MGGAERVVLALGTTREAGQAAALADGAHAVASPREDLVRIGLMADVPDQPVAGRVEGVVQRNGELDHAESGAEMAAGDGNGIDRFLTQLIRELPQLADLEPTQFFWTSNAIEQRF